MTTKTIICYYHITTALLFFFIFSLLVFPVEKSKAENISELIETLPDMPDSTGTKYYFYSQLNDAEKAIYQKMLAATPDDNSFSVSGLEKENAEYMIRRAYDACISDNPFLHAYWERYVTFVETETVGSYTIELKRNAIAELHRINEAELYADAIVSNVGLEDDIYTRVRNLITIMTYEMSYDNTALPDTNYSAEMKDSVLGCLIDGHAICAGFSDTFKYLCDRLEIPCICVGNAGHAWNFVRMDDGKWYSVDSSSITGADSFTDVSLQEEYISQELLLGSESDAYVGNPNYHLSADGDPEFYNNMSDGGFSFPILSEEQYNYSGTYVDKYSGPVYTGSGSELIFLTEANSDGNSCTIVGLSGTQSGDLIIPGIINGLSVTVIGEDAFRYCRGFSGELHIPDSVLEIRQNAFFGCYNLTGALRFPANLRFLGSGAFFGCKNLIGDIILPNTLEYLGEQGVFGDCAKLNGTFLIPDHINFDASIILDTNISSLEVADTNELYCVIDGVLYTKDGKTLLCCPTGKSGELTIPDGVITIAHSAFYNCSSLNTVHFPNTLKTIERFAFQKCGLQGDLYLPNSIREIGYAAFGVDGGYSGVRKLHLPEGLTSLGEGAFSNCGFSGDLFIPATLSAITDRDGQVAPEAILFFNGNQFDHLIVINNSYMHNYITNPPYSSYYEAGNRVYKDLRIIEPKDNYHITVTFDFNDGTGLTETIGTTCGFSVSMSNIIPTRENFLFLGWAESPDSTDVQYYSDGDYYFEQDTLLYAVWIDSSEVTTGRTEPFSWKMMNGEITITDCDLSSFDSELMIPDVIEGYPVCGIDKNVISGSTIYEKVYIPKRLRWIGKGNFIGGYSRGSSYLMYSGNENDFRKIAFADDNNLFNYNNHVFFTWAPDNSCLTMTQIKHWYPNYPEKLTVNASCEIVSSPTDTEPGIVTFIAVFDFTVFSKYATIPELSSLNVLYLPFDLTTIENESFEETNCQAVIISENCESIGNRAFANCVELLYVRIPPTLSNIADNAFEGCPNVIIDRTY